MATNKEMTKKFSPLSFVAVFGSGIRDGSGTGPGINSFDIPGNKVNLEEVCAGKKVVIFGVPGAFTPGCSKTHLPGRIRN